MDRFNPRAASKLLEHNVWIWEEGSNYSCDGTWKKPEHSNGDTSIDTSASKTVTTLVTNWCEDFVLALDLCPWAKASLQTRGAMRFFLVPPSSSSSSSSFETRPQETQRQRMGTIVDTVTKRFQTEILARAVEGGATSDKNPSSSVLEKAAIYFLVFLPNEHNCSTEEQSPVTMLPDSFFDFIDWFTELEEDWPEEYDNVIVAPFHPSWEFGGSASGVEACLDYEKRSPYPLVTLVSTDVVEKAGAIVTEAIGEHNKQVLLGIEREQRESSEKSHYLNASVGELWWSAVYGNTAKKTTQ